MTDETRYAIYPSLRDAVVLVSGGASGLGAEFVAQFAAQGARVAFVDVAAEAGEALVAEVAERDQPRPVFRACDVRDLDAYRRVIAEIAAELGDVQVLVNNAGSDTRHPVAEVEPRYWDERMRVNLDHQFFAAQAVAPAMRAAGRGSIINMGSISAHVDLLDLTAYMTAKAGIEGLTRSLSREYGPDGVRVNCVLPGWIMTPRQLENWMTPEADAHRAAAQALPHRLEPGDVARLVLWLAADDSRSCTGQRWVVDGGWLHS
ncbi:SDR family NAD(P)-dependent oxidoreductase [Pseudonocardia kunmingensis]|uniref:NAD(P)-dependent dehydrogenase (Short-subunit alcohol dehydrogenase family) n=1 Tax=Pseudonocardia kunmingensis TaxID=630975 RepID=A0A543DAE6_9PSEU|nr:SDR family oxidoreductase [Pseudonocardia kunmingensis]TQM06302.1 NAD(P)-dependent dehydrogenase (short-subunit alcohol dehydrogenase family) [Pseudonocardia kunmingensis]